MIRQLWGRKVKYETPKVYELLFDMPSLKLTPLLSVPWVVSTLTGGPSQLSQSGQVQTNCEREVRMGKVAPFHSKRPNDRNVYHDSDKCTEGNNIESYNRVSGTGGRARCEHCAKLA